MFGPHPHHLKGRWKVLSLALRVLKAHRSGDPLPPTPLPASLAGIQMLSGSTPNLNLRGTRSHPRLPLKAPPGCIQPLISQDKMQLKDTAPVCHPPLCSDPAHWSSCLTHVIATHPSCLRVHRGQPSHLHHHDSPRTHSVPATE